MKPIAVILSGCGVFDGSEIHEAVLTLLALSREGVPYQCLAPNVLQQKVVNHFTHEIMAEQRNVLVEAARIARGKILDLSTVNIEAYAAAIFPGGFGAACNLSNFAATEGDYQINPQVEKFARAMAEAKKPLGFICIAPHLIPKIYGAPVNFTIGHDADTALRIESAGAQHQACSVNDIVVDAKHGVVTTPAYMLGQTPADIEPGIHRLVQKIIELSAAK